MFLAIDTCTERLLVGLRSTPPSADRWTNLASPGDGPANHGRDLLPVIQALLEGQRPKVIGVALGPGSFTGVRIGLSTAKGLAEGWGIPLVALDNLAAMATSWSRLFPQSPAAVLSVIDARKNKFYGSLWAGGRELLAASDRSAVDWVEAVASVWSGPVVASGYQGSHLEARLADQFPASWTSFDTQDWAPGLLDQTEAGWQEGRWLPTDVAPRYLRLSEAEENLRARSS